MSYNKVPLSHWKYLITSLHAVTNSTPPTSQSIYM